MHAFVGCVLAGVVSTAVSARLLLGLGLMATAAVNLAFGASSSMAAFCTLWGINGMLQVGSCTGSCVMLLRHPRPCVCHHRCNGTAALHDNAVSVL